MASLFTTRSSAYGAVPTTEAAPFSALTGEGGDGVVHVAPAPRAGRLRGWLAGLSPRAKALTAIALVAGVAGLIAGVVLARKASPAASVCAWRDYRLPGNVAPRNYTIVWSADTDGAAFTAPYSYRGLTTVDVDVLAASPCVLLHSVGLAIASINATDLTTGVTTPVAWEEDAANERLVLRLATPAGPGGAGLRLSLAYSAPLATNNYGLYAANFTNDAGKPTIMVS